MEETDSFLKAFPRSSMGSCAQPPSPPTISFTSWKVHWSLSTSLISLHGLHASVSAALSGPGVGEHTVDVEISFENVSFMESFKTQLHGLSFPIQVNDNSLATEILSIDVTTGE